jgi:hypothetical protein
MDGAVAGDPRHSGKAGSDDGDTPVAFAGAVVAGMTGMTVAFVLDLER